MFEIYKHDDGTYHAKNVETGRDLTDGLHQPVRNRLAALLGDYLHWLGLRFQYAE